MGTQGTEKVLFKNEGKLKADLRLKTNKSFALQIKPDDFSIDPS